MRPINLDLRVFSNANNIICFASGNQLITSELSDELNWHFGLLILDQLVALLSDGALDGDTVHSLLVKWHSNLEVELAVLEG